MKIGIFLGIVAVFLVGWVANDVYTETAEQLNPAYFESPQLTETQDTVTSFGGIDQLQELLVQEPKQEKLGPRERASPQDWIPMENIHVYSNRIVIDIQNPEWAIFTDTNSMDPVLDAESNAIELVPKSAEQLAVGDIVAYRSKYQDGVVTHRIIEIGEDNKGWYARIKGDNNDSVDPGKVRFDQIERVVVAVIY